MKSSNGVSIIVVVTRKTFGAGTRSSFGSTTCAAASIDAASNVAQKAAGRVACIDCAAFRQLDEP